MSDFYQVVGQNNRNTLVQSKRIAPYHEDKTKVQPFEPSSISPGQYSRIKIDMKHANDREIILNDLRLQFQLDMTARHLPGTPLGAVHAIRGTDLIRELVVKINEDIVFKVDKQGELSFMWEMNNHRMDGSPDHTHNAYLLNAGIIPPGRGCMLAQRPENDFWYTLVADTSVDPSPATWTWMDETPNQLANSGDERHDGLPRLIAFHDIYKCTFNMSLNSLVGPIFHKLHLRRIEYVQIEIMFEPFISYLETQKFLLFCAAPTPTVDGVQLAHPYSVAKYTNLQVQQYRTTLLDGINGFTLPDNRMLSWLMHRYTKRVYEFDYDQGFIDIPLNDFEIRTNITRVLWMVEPVNQSVTGRNGFAPLAPATAGYRAGLSACELRWKNDVVIDLDNSFDIRRHYILSDNKRYNFNDPYIHFQRLRTIYPLETYNPLGASNTSNNDGAIRSYNWIAGVSQGQTLFQRNIPIGQYRYEFPVYHLDLNMNIQSGAPGSEVIGGIVNDTSDYVLRIKKLQYKAGADWPVGKGKIWVFLEYQTLVNLSANSNQFSRGSQIVTKQLNPQ
jgi:hypothetical protein